MPFNSIRAYAGVTSAASAIAWGSGLCMSAIQHIVAPNARAKCNNMALISIWPLRHNGAMDETDSNGGPNHLKAWREFRRLSQLELAEKVGTSHQVIGYLERGRTQLSAKWLRLLAPALDTTPGMLLDHNPGELDRDIIEMWANASSRERKQIVGLVRTLTGTDD